MQIGRVELPSLAWQASVLAVRRNLHWCVEWESNPQIPRSKRGEFAIPLSAHGFDVEILDLETYRDIKFQKT